jgi:hypothetical protein
MHRPHRNVLAHTSTIALLNPRARTRELNLRVRESNAPRCYTRCRELDS